MDLPHFVLNPNYAASLMKARFPKRHHPACDRKGQNDCDCHTYSNGALGIMALRESFRKSQELSPLYRRKRRLEHRLKVKRIRAYYNSITEAELWLPKDAGFRQFRFFLWDNKQERVVVRVIKDNFRHKRTLLKWLRRLAPLHVYYTTSAWLNPQGIGPDPKGKHGKAKMKKKGWTLERYHDTMLYQGLYFDVDYDNADYNEGANMMNRLLLNAMVMFTQSRRGSRIRYFFAGLDKKPKMVFSGSKGFHLIFEDWDSSRLERLEMMRYKAHVAKDGTQGFHSNAKQSIVNRLKEMDEKLLLDWEVTQDPRRIIRLPGTVHGKTMRLCKVVTLDDFDITDEGWSFKADAPIA
jgi:DNA primase catalytic subunit